MREIKFRGKNINGKWVYGSLLISEVDVKQKFINAEIHERFADSFSIKKHEVNHETVGQFIGLTDKNGKEIYEGDVLKRRGIANSYVEYYNGEWVIRHDDDKGEWRSPLVNTYYLHREIIGNIHDNPNLLT